MRLLLFATVLSLVSGVCYSAMRSYRRRRQAQAMLLPDIYRAIVGADQEMFV